MTLHYICRQHCSHFFAAVIRKATRSFSRGGQNKTVDTKQTQAINWSKFSATWECTYCSGFLLVGVTTWRRVFEKIRLYQHSHYSLSCWAGWQLTHLTNVVHIQGCRNRHSLSPKRSVDHQDSLKADLDPKPLAHWANHHFAFCGSDYLQN